METSALLGIGDPPLGFRFGVFFFAGGAIPNPLDILFQKVSGLAASVNTHEINEGGQNLYTQSLPQHIQYENLTLERGLATVSPLTIEFHDTMTRFQFQPSNVLVTLLDGGSIPIASWMFLKAYPLKWQAAALDATANAVVIETLELKYQRMQPIML